MTGQNVLRGMGSGAIMGAFMGFGGGVVGAAGTSSSGLLNAGIIGTAGAAGGGTNAAVYGGNVARAAAFGAGFAIAGYAIGPTNYQFLGCVKTANCGWAGPVSGTFHYLANSALRGAAFGAVEAGVRGKNILDGAAAGAEAWTIAAGFNMVIGHAVGLAATGRLPDYDAKNGVFIYDNADKWFARFTGLDRSAVTLGNVISAGPDVLGLSNPAMPLTTVGDHEVSHFNTQGALL
jgi:hypothetical protein